MFLNVVLEKTLESTLDHKEVKPVHPKENHSWIFIGRTDAKAETPILQPADVKNWLIRKDPDTVKEWRWEEKGTTEDEMVGWHHWLNGHEFEQAPGDGDGQGGLVSCLKTQTWLSNWTEGSFPPLAMQRSFTLTYGNRVTSNVFFNIWHNVCCS